MKKFIDKKKEAETKIHKILNNFREETGVNIHYVDFSKKEYVGFSSDEDFDTKIMLKNE